MINEPGQEWDFFRGLALELLALMNRASAIADENEAKLPEVSAALWEAHDKIYEAMAAATAFEYNTYYKPGS
jgi:hypothetical protein